MQKFIPPLWLPVAAGALAEGRVVSALLGTLGCLVIGAARLASRVWGHGAILSRGYSAKRPLGRLALIGCKPSPRLPARPRAGSSKFVSPRVPEQAAALALATFRSMLRAPEIKMAWASSFLVPLIVGASFLLRGPPKMPEAVKPFIGTSAVVFSVFMVVQFLSNQFGFDRDGFRVLILSPVDRRLVLLGKNVASLPVAAAFGLMLLALICAWMRPPILTVAATLIQIPCAVLIAGLAGNLLSILVPYRIQPGSMKPTKMPGLAMLGMLVCHLLFPAAMAPVFVAPLADLLWRKAGWPNAVPINLLVSATLLALTLLVYWQMLGPLGRLLQRRETKILNVVTVEVE